MSKVPWWIVEDPFFTPELEELRLRTKRKIPRKEQKKRKENPGSFFFESDWFRFDPYWGKKADP